MKQLAEFLPLLAFVAAYYLYDIYMATAVFMAAVTLQMLWYLVRKQIIPTQMKFIFVVAWVFGGLTLLLHDKTFIQWKPTIVNWAMAIALIGSHYFGSDNFVKKMLGSQLKLPDSAWTHLNFGWAFGFTLSGILNLFVAYNFSESFWVSYKLIGGTGITFLYVAIMLTYLHRGGYLELQPDDKEPQLGNELQPDNEPQPNKEPQSNANEQATTEPTSKDEP